MAGVVALEEGLVDRDVLDPDDPLPLLEVDDPVHQQHGVAVREVLHDPLHVDLGLVPPAEGVLGQGAAEGHVSPMARAVGDHVAGHPCPEEREIPEHVARLVTDELVGEAQLLVQDAALVEDHAVLHRGRPGPPSGPELLGVLLEPEGSGGSDLATEGRPVGVELEGSVLSSDRGVLVFDRAREAKAPERDRHVGSVSVRGKREGFLDLHHPGGGVLGLHPGVGDGLEVVEEAAVPDRGFGPVELHDGVGDPVGPDSREEVLHGEDAGLALPDRGAELRVHHVVQVGGDLGRVLQVRPAKSDPGAGRSGSDPGTRGLARMHPDALHDGLTGQRPLLHLAHGSSVAPASGRNSGCRSPGPRPPDASWLNPPCPAM